MALCRRVLVMEWVTGVKLTTLEPVELRRLVGVGQAAFLTQLLDIGFFHGDPHPGNLLKVTVFVPTGIDRQRRSGGRKIYVVASLEIRVCEKVKVGLS
jgi:predicted unusual protein kinase regulating ubiquinone biosynthesis (AarF/ABC1/UbiB family)